MIEVDSAQTGEALEQLITLSQEYVAWMLGQIREHYPELDLHEFASEHNYEDINVSFG